MSVNAANGLAAPEGDDVQLIYYYYEVARGLTGGTADDAAAAYSRILTFSAPTADKKARTLANSFIPDLFAAFAARQDLASRAVESMIDFCEDEDTKIRMGTIKRLPDMAVHSHSDSDKELIIDILIQLLQAQVPAELQIVRSSLEKAAAQLPAVASRQLWAMASSTNEPVLQQVAVSWITSSGKTLLGSAPEFGAGGITAVKNITDVKLLGRLLPTLLSLQSMKGGDDEGSKQLLTDLLDALVAKAPDASLLTDSNETSQEYIAFLPKWVVNILTRHASSNSLIKYLASTAVPAILNKNISDSKGQTHILRLSVEGCASVPASTEFGIFIPKLKDLVVLLAHDLENDKKSASNPESLECNWAVLEPATIAIYIAIRRAPSYPISTDSSPDLTPALRAICSEAQLALPNLRRRLAQHKPESDEAIKSEKTRLQCNNVLDVAREMLKLPALRSKNPPQVRFSWRPRAVAPVPAAAVQKKQKVGPSQAVLPTQTQPNGSGKKVNLKRRASELGRQPSPRTPDKVSDGGTRAGRRRGGAGRKRK
ncbi:hypothetical protein V1517DRAFT_337948 [Lipomyces orientalis]|uniref:Uncharacterized protein n=1 Tax=Lipomyces orientalis TaxID=1233043 RepID=A0ACC3TQJ9_9ASCO